MGEWQTIHSAPSNGEKVLVFGGRFGVEVALADGEWWQRQRREGSVSVPSHWMPLPRPPGIGTVADTPKTEGKQDQQVKSK